MWGKLAAAMLANQLMQDPLYSISSSKPSAFHISNSLSCSADARLMLGAHLPIFRQIRWHLAARTCNAFLQSEPATPLHSLDIEIFLIPKLSFVSTVRSKMAYWLQRLSSLESGLSSRRPTNTIPTITAVLWHFFGASSASFHCDLIRTRRLGSERKEGL